MRFVCDSCRAQYMISDEKVGAKGVKVRCKKCGFVILVRRMQEVAPPPPRADEGVQATQVMQNPLVGDPHDEPTAAGAPEDGAAAVHAALENAFGDGGSEADPSEPRGGAPAPETGIFAGVEEDEIGAVFDQVLNSGTHRMGASANPEGDASGEDAGLGLGEETNDDRLSTRVLDAETVRKLAEEAAGGEAGGAKVVVSKGAAAEPEKHDWFVAIDERQVGPLTLEKVKGHWDAGEIGPDSLCWRAGFSDWMPLSEVDELAPVLAPQPKKPVIVGSGEDGDAPTLPPGPVESAFSARARTVTPASVPAVAATAGDGGGGWKPSAASALASLVKEEIEALARPPQPETPAADPLAAAASESRDEPVRGLLDLPSEEHRMGDLGADEEAAAPSSTASAASSLAFGAGTSSAASTGSGAMPRAGRPDPVRASRPANAPAAAIPPAAAAASSGGLPRPLLIGGAVMLGLVVVLVVAVLALAFREGGSSAPVAQVPAQPTPVQVAQAQPSTPPVQPAAPTELPPAPAAAEPASAEPSEGAKAEVAAAVAPKAEDPPKAEPAPAAEPKRAEPVVARRTERAAAQPAPAPAPRSSAPAPAPAPQEERAARTTTPAEAADDFDAVFGGGSRGSSRKGAAAPTKTAAAPTKGSDSVYIPPAPGSSTGPVRLGQSDIMAVVLQNKAAIQRCVNEQKDKDPSVSGTLVMQWSIRTSGTTERINVQSAEFRSTHVATCMGGLIRGWRFPAHQEQGEPINFPFKF